MVATAVGADDKVSLSGSVMTGTLGLQGTPALNMPAGAADGYVLTSDADGNISPQPLAALPSMAANVTVTSSATLALNTATEASAASGSLTMTLPAPVTGALIVCEKSDSSTSTVAITGSIRGAGSSTITLKLQNESEMFLGYGGSWWPIAGHKTLSSLQALFANVFSPMAFGAKGDGTTDDSTAVLAAFSAASTAKGTVDVGTRTFLTSSAIPLASGTKVRGAAQGGGGLVNSTTDLFSVTGTVQQFSFEDVALTASAGHVFNCAAGSFTTYGRFKAVVMTQQNSGYGIWYMPDGTYIGMLVGDECSLICNSAATVVPWQVIGLANSNTWYSLRATAGASVTVPFFQVECDSASAFSSGNTFRDVVGEICVAGIIKALTVSNLTIENVLGYDATSYTSSLFYVGTGTGGGRSQDITVRNSGRIGGTLGSGAFDFQAASTTQAILLENVGPESATWSYSTPANFTTITGGLNSNSFVQSASLAASGIAPSPAPSRLVGGSTVTGSPASGTWNKLDTFTDSAGTIWVCTTAGTPGTWTQVQPTPGAPLALAAGGTGVSAASSAALLTSLGAASAASVLTGIPTAASQGYAGWTSDPLGGTLLGAPASSTWAGGVLYARRVDVIPNLTVNGFITYQWLTHASMASTFFSVWTLSGTTITLVGSTADLSAIATGWHRTAVTSFTSTPASGVLYVTYMNGTSAVAGGPFTERGAWSQAVPTLTSQLPPGNAGQYRWMSGGSGLTSPSAASPFSLSGGSIGALPFWCALD